MNKKFIPISQPSITQKEIRYVNNAVSSGWVSSLGLYIDEFEKRFAKFVGTKYALATTNGTAGLHLALASLGIGKGDEVIIPDFTFVATANAVVYAGATPIMVDIEKDTLCIDPRQIEKHLTKKTKAIMPVHIYGHPANMAAINKIAKKHKLLVIEDAAEAHGALIGKKMVGSFGNFGVFSFYGNKIITTGEGGMITTNNKKLYEHAKYLRDHAMSKQKRYWHTELGFNYRMTNIQAALGVAQMERINDLILKKRQIFSWYKKYLWGLPGVRLNFTAPGVKNVYWMVCLEVDGFNEDIREELMHKLKAKGVDSRPYFYPISDLPMYNRGRVKTPITHQVYKTGINLPSFYSLTEREIIYICKVIKGIL